MSFPGKPLRILFVTQFYYPDVTACAFRMHETAQLLAKMGCDVEVIAGEPHKGDLGQQIDDGPVRVSRVKLIKYAGKGKWNYIAHYLSFMFGAVKASRRHRGSFDVVWASSPPLFTGIAGWAIAKLKKTRLCLDIRDIWPESAVVAGQISGTGILFKAAKVVEWLLYRLTDQLTCVARPMADYIERTSGGRRPQIIYNAIPASMVAEQALPVDSNPDPLRILYIGNMGYCQNLSLVIEAAKILAAEGNQKIRFVIVGNGIEKPMLENAVKNGNLRNVEIKGIVSKERAIEMIRETHALMLHLKDDGTMDKTIPSKVFDYMAGGRPILYGLKGEACDILGSASGNLYYDPADASQLAAQARYLQQNYQQLAENAGANLTLVKGNYLRDRMAERLKEIFASM
ncbi:MAG: hypothetical protein CVV42_16255 [Candidatus Riflebacteria bacterium HGW-Riflebacteria-2]|jgi:glycosyltransferase involved in cell wall biosynthesis|nr:MAG: hypothetical protein CVV42_16255 [Candidatus Riflebacteria bacterium HGW-Riflebacteria-2]